MQYEAEVNGRMRRIAVKRQDGRLLVDVDGRTWVVDAVPVGKHALSLLIADPAVGTSSEGRTRSREVTVTPDRGSGQLNVHLGGTVVPVLLNGRRRSGRKEEGGHSGSGSGPQQVLAPMPGKVVRVLVKIGDRVQARQPIVVIEAMKMENELRSGRDGVVTDVPVSDGQSVDAGALLAVIAGSIEASAAG